MKTLIIYHSEHHDNTKKLLNAIAQQGDVTLAKSDNLTITNWEDFDLIGFASGIYYQNFHKDVLKYAEKYLPAGKKVFFIYTCGVKRSSYTNTIKQITDAKNAEIAGCYACLGYDTFGPFKLIGGIAKGHPDNQDLADAITFFNELDKT